MYTLTALNPKEKCFITVLSSTELQYINYNCHIRVDSESIRKLITSSIGVYVFSITGNIEENKVANSIGFSKEEQFSGEEIAIKSIHISRIIAPC
jgi:hypothetical protein